MLFGALRYRAAAIGFPKEAEPPELRVRTTTPKKAETMKEMEQELKFLLGGIVWKGLLALQATP
jgi:hypothetical protein